MLTARVSLVVILLAVAAAASPAGATTQNRPVLLDLGLHKSDLKPAPERKPAPVYASTVQADPWGALDERTPRVVGSQIPQVSLEQMEHPAIGEDFSLRKLLDGTTFTILRIELAPTY